MSDYPETAPPATAVARLSLSLRVSGVPVLVGTAMLASRLIWEQTVWTWERGPQMVGFSLAHGPGAILFVFPLLLLIWTAIIIALTVLNMVRRKTVELTRWAWLGVGVLLLAVMELPEGFWQRAFISRMAASRRAGDLLVYAAYRGDIGTVRAFLSHGVAVNATDHADWRTAMHAAAVKGDTKIIRYLVSKGADVNAIDRSGDSPLELAASRDHEEASNFLIERGAKRIRGDEVQRQKAIHDKVQEDMEQLYRAEGILPGTGRKPTNPH